MLVCRVCGPFHRFPSGKTHKSRTKHQMRDLTPEERLEEISWYREIQADGEAARLEHLAKKRRDARQGREAGAPTVVKGLESGQKEACDAVPAASREYIFDSGKYRGKTLLDVWRRFPGYLPYLINQGNFLETRIALRRAMQEAGILDSAQALAA